MKMPVFQGRCLGRSPTESGKSSRFAWKRAASSKRGIPKRIAIGLAVYLKGTLLSVAVRIVPTNRDHHGPAGNGIADDPALKSENISNHCLCQNLFG